MGVGASRGKQFVAHPDTLASSREKGSVGKGWEMAKNRGGEGRERERDKEEEGEERRKKRRKKKGNGERRKAITCCANDTDPCAVNHHRPSICNRVLYCARDHCIHRSRAPIVSVYGTILHGRVCVYLCLCVCVCACAK